MVYVDMRTEYNKTADKVLEERVKVYRENNDIMAKPTKEAIDAMTEQVMADLAVIRSIALSSCTAYERDAMASIETFVAIALRVMAKTNASKLRDVMRTVEIVARMDGKEVIGDK